MPSIGPFARFMIGSAAGPGLRGLARSQDAIDRSLERLATGQRINRAADDPDGLVALEGLRGDYAAIEAELRTIDRDQAWLAARDGALSVVGERLIELGGLVRRAANTGGLGEGEHDAIQLEIDSIIDGIGLTYTNASFGGVGLFSAGILGMAVEKPSPDEDRDTAGAGVTGFGTGMLRDASISVEQISRESAERVLELIASARID